MPALVALALSLSRIRRGIDFESLVLLGDGRLQIVGAGGTAPPRELDGGSTILGPLLVLGLRGSARPRWILLMADSFSRREDYRFVRRWALSRLPAAR